ncbi:MAG: N,N-dimethylformamidase beta subunit family domain-containing protein, partial [Catenulispora sp.]
VRNGERIPNLVAGEADQVWPGKGGPEVTYLAVSPFTGNGKDDKPTRMPAHTVLYQQDSGAWVFNAGTFYWNHGLSTPRFADARIQRATRNLLDRMTRAV